MHYVSSSWVLSRLRKVYGTKDLSPDDLVVDSLDNLDSVLKALRDD